MCYCSPLTSYQKTIVDEEALNKILNGEYKDWEEYSDLVNKAVDPFHFTHSLLTSLLLSYDTQCNAFHRLIEDQKYMQFLKFHHDKNDLYMIRRIFGGILSYMHENDLLSYNKVLDSLVSSDILEHKQWFKTKNKLWYALGLYNQLPYKRHIRHALFTIPELEELEKMISEFINKACTVGNDELFQQMQKETTDMISFHLLKSNAENLGISNFFSVVANEKYLDFDSIRIERCFEL